MAFDLAATVRFLHVLFGIVWIGHLYFFNLTNLPVFKMSIKDNDASQKGGPHLMMRALWWFRWGAMLTLLFGLILFYYVTEGVVGDGNTYADHGAYLVSDVGMPILFGMALGIIMWVNVWFIIWPNQKVILGNNVKIAKGVSAEEKTKLEAENAPRANKAKLASRVNFWLSIPMLFFMIYANHGGLFV